jgi:hypothetical protein
LPFGWKDVAGKWRCFCLDDIQHDQCVESFQRALHASCIGERADGISAEYDQRPKVASFNFVGHR